MSSQPPHQTIATLPPWPPPRPQPTLLLPIPATRAHQVLPIPATMSHQGRSKNFLWIRHTPKHTKPPSRVHPTTRSGPSDLDSPPPTRGGPSDLDSPPALMKTTTPLRDRGDGDPQTPTTPANTGLNWQTDTGTRNASFGTVSSPSWDGGLSSPSSPCSPSSVSCRPALQ